MWCDDHLRRDEVIALACILVALLSVVGVVCFWLDQGKPGGVFSPTTYRKAMALSFCVLVLAVVFWIIARAQGWP